MVGGRLGAHLGLDVHDERAVFLDRRPCGRRPGVELRDGTLEAHDRVERVLFPVRHRVPPPGHLDQAPLDVAGRPPHVPDLSGRGVDRPLEALALGVDPAELRLETLAFDARLLRQQLLLADVGTRRRGHLDPVVEVLLDDLVAPLDLGHRQLLLGLFLRVGVEQQLQAGVLADGRLAARAERLLLGARLLDVCFHPGVDAHDLLQRVPLMPGIGESFADCLIERLQEHGRQPVHQRVDRVEREQEKDARRRVLFVDDDAAAKHDRVLERLLVRVIERLLVRVLERLLVRLLVANPPLATFERRRSRRTRPVLFAFRHFQLAVPPHVAVRHGRVRLPSVDERHMFALVRRLRRQDKHRMIHQTDVRHRVSHDREQRRDLLVLVRLFRRIEDPDPLAAHVGRRRLGRHQSTGVQQARRRSQDSDAVFEIRRIRLHHVPDQPRRAGRGDEVVQRSVLFEEAEQRRVKGRCVLFEEHLGRLDNVGALHHRRYRPIMNQWMLASRQ